MNGLPRRYSTLSLPTPVLQVSLQELSFTSRHRNHLLALEATNFSYSADGNSDRRFFLELDSLSRDCSSAGLHISSFFARFDYPRKS